MFLFVDFFFFPSMYRLRRCSLELSGETAGGTERTTERGTGQVSISLRFPHFISICFSRVKRIALRYLSTNKAFTRKRDVVGMVFCRRTWLKAHRPIKSLFFGGFLFFFFFALLIVNSALWILSLLQPIKYTFKLDSCFISYSIPCPAFF